MRDFSKIKQILEPLGYQEEDKLMFTLRRFERLDPHHIKLSEKNKEKIIDIFEKFHSRYSVNFNQKEFPSSHGILSLKLFVEFLEEYDEKFDLTWCEIDLKEITLKPMYL